MSPILINTSQAPLCYRFLKARDKLVILKTTCLLILLYFFYCNSLICLAEKIQMPLKYFLTFFFFDLILND